MHRFLYIWILLMASTVGAQEVTVELQPSTCHPGDLIQLIAKMESAEFASMDLELPLPDALHLVGKEQQAVRYDAALGQYSQTETWILQARYSGKIELSNLSAQLTSATGRRQIQLPNENISIAPYSALEDEDSPAYLSTQTNSTGTSTWNYWWLAPLVLSTAVILYLKNQHSSKQTTPETISNSLEDILAKLEAGEIPHQAIEDQLARPHEDFSAALRHQLEHLLYAEDPDQKKALSALRKELSA